MIAPINIKYIISHRLKRRAYLTGDPVSAGAISQKVKSAFWSLRYHVRLAFICSTMLIVNYFINPRAISPRFRIAYRRDVGPKRYKTNLLV